MIRIHKPKTGPVELVMKGRVEAGRLSKAYEGSPGDYQSGVKTFTFDGSVYASAIVKEALVRAQHGKCAFCESAITHIAYGDVEHFRPKGGVRQTEQDELLRPGYYWLTYEWGNLLVACQLCNQKFKKNLFPLEDPAKRARCHRDGISAERPLLINPAEEDPGALIAFHAEIPFAAEGNARAAATIHTLGLDRDELNEMRLQWLGSSRVLWGLMRLAADRPHDVELQSLAAKARTHLAERRRDEAQYAAMFRAAFPSGE